MDIILHFPVGCPIFEPARVVPRNISVVTVNKLHPWFSLCIDDVKFQLQPKYVSCYFQKRSLARMFTKEVYVLVWRGVNIDFIKCCNRYATCPRKWGIFFIKNYLLSVVFYHGRINVFRALFGIILFCKFSSVCLLQRTVSCTVIVLVTAE